MSDGMEMLLELLPWNSSLQKKDNPLHIILDKTVGEWLDHFEQPYEQLFLLTATGGWLDAHGKDYGVLRRIDETDESYRQRIIYEKLDHLTPQLLSDIYNIRLFTYREDFNILNNTLVSDNPYILQENRFMGVAEKDTISILDNKFVLDTVITWINEVGTLDYILTNRGVNILNEYGKIYTISDLKNYFKNNNSIVKFKLHLPFATKCSYMFDGCTSLISIQLDSPLITVCMNMFGGCTALTDVDLNLPSVTNCNEMFISCSSLTSIDLDLPNATLCSGMFMNCTALKSVKLNIPNVMSYEMFYGCSNIETINVNIPTSRVNGFKYYITSLNLQHLTSLIINGDEQL